MMSADQPLAEELLLAVDLRKLDKVKLINLLLATIDEEELISIINRRNDEIINRALDRTKKEKGRWFTMLTRVGGSTIHALADNTVAETIRSVFAKQRK